MDVLLEYWAKTMTPQDRIHLIVIGDGPCKEELEEQAKELGISEMVTFTGRSSTTSFPPTSPPVTSTSPHPCRTLTPSPCWRGWPPVCRCSAAGSLNEDQVRNGVNGYVFNSPEEMAARLRYVKNMSPEQLAILKVGYPLGDDSGAEDLDQLHADYLPQTVKSVVLLFVATKAAGYLSGVFCYY